MPRKRNEQKEQCKNFNKAFPTVMRQLMKKTTQADLAEYLSKTRQAITYYCDGSSSPDWETLVKIADFFDVSTDYLLGRTFDPSRQPCAVDELGLAKENVDYLKNPSMAMGRGETVLKVNNLVHTFINDVLDICREEGLQSEFQIMQHILARVNRLIPRESGEGLPSFDMVDEYIRRNGLFVLPAKDGATYYAKQIGNAIARGFMEKYVHPSHRGDGCIGD